MLNSSENQTSGKSSHGRLRLPFEKKHTDAGTWSYIHRRGICVTLIAYLLFAILFISAKISLSRGEGVEGIVIDFSEELQQERERVEKNEQRFYDYSDVANRQSNENALTEGQLRNDRSSSASEMYEDANAIKGKMLANRQAYEDGLRKEQMIIENARSGQNDNRQAQDVKVKGKVTVSFSFVDPVRTSRNLIVPAYMCEGGGEVTVNVFLNINGEVVSAAVDRVISSSDQCMQNTALNAARGSLFNLDSSAPQKHRGTISYIFIPQ